VIVVAFALRDFDTLYCVFGYHPHTRGGPSLWLVMRCLIVTFFVFIPFDEIYTPLLNILYGQQEHQADAFATSLGYGVQLCSVLLKMEDGRVYEMDPLYAAYYNDHPLLLERRTRMGC